MKLIDNKNNEVKVGQKIKYKCEVYVMKNNKLTEEQLKELEKLLNEIMDEAKSVVEDYTKNPSLISGSVQININENSPFLDSDENDEPMFSGSRWTKVIKRN